MPDIKNLYETLAEKAFNLNITKPEIPEYIKNNLKYSLFDWQEKAISNFLTYQLIKGRENPNSPTHLMFNMATGTGKTLLMASTILYYYKQGYRSFLFFVNQNNIVSKTEENFINSSHEKYLFSNKIIIEDKTIPIKQVDSFSDNPQGIEIKFTTIQKLYNDIHIQKENQVTLDDLYKRNIVMLADEAHHLNADTRNRNGIQEELVPEELTAKSSKVEIERKGWEHTVIELILNKKSNSKDNKNVLLEFTATIPENEQIEKKYEDKIIFKFGLKEFLSAGYTKEINLISSSLSKNERILQALLFNWYRHKIAVKNNIPNFKPVILFRSKTIEESKNDYESFLDLTSNLKLSDFDFLKNIVGIVSQGQSIYEQGKTRTEQVLNFIKNENINYGEVVNYIKNNFTDRTVIITNSETNKTKSEEITYDQEKLLNSLENKENHIRGIFTVQRLNEGWDVLNLFDIVRLYETRDEGADAVGNRRAGSSTVAEKQLIGRGVRYYPFAFKDMQINKRKFDDDINNELRILEELFFYSINDSRYIDELKRELKKDGYIRDDREFKTFDIKKSFKESPYYKIIKIWENKQIDNPNRKKTSLEEIKDEFINPYVAKGNVLREEVVDFDKEEKQIRENAIDKKWKPNFSILVKDIEKHIFRKAINIIAKDDNSVCRFKALSQELNIKSIDDLQKDEFLGNFKITAILNKDQNYDNLPNSEKLDMVLDFLNIVFYKLKENISPKIGTTEFYPRKIEEVFREPKTKVIDRLNLNDNISTENDWYILDGFAGTSEEKGLVDFIEKQIQDLKSKYAEVFLLRNEEVYKIYDFDKGMGFQPDFILFLKDKSDKNLYYQVFIEPKGGQFTGYDGTLKTGHDGWKETFLEKITEKFGKENILKAENNKYYLIGLPFYSSGNNTNFETEYSKFISDIS